MNNSNPLIPQGSNLEQKTKGRSRVKLAVIVVLAMHVLFLGPLLMQGCKREQPPAPVAETIPQPPLDSPTNELPPLTTNVAPPPPVTANTPVVVTPPLPAAGMTEYTVVKGDSFYTLGKRFGVSMKAIADANPGVDSAKLKIGQPLHIPPPAAAAAGTTGNGAVTPADGDKPYEVKSGDTLSKIAAAHGTTVKAIRSLNNLTTDKIKVGQKLKLPEPKAAAPAPAPAQPGLPPAAVPPAK